MAGQEIAPKGILMAVAAVAMGKNDKRELAPPHMRITHRVVHKQLIDLRDRHLVGFLNRSIDLRRNAAGQKV